MRASSPARAPKSQLAVEQPSTGRHWNPPKKATPHPKTKEKPQWNGRRATITIKSNPILAGLLTDWRTIIPRVCTDYSQNLSPDTPSKASKNQRSEWERGLLKQGGILGFLKSLRDRDLTAPSAPVHPWPVDQPGGFLSKTSVFLTIKIDTKAWFQWLHQMAWNQIRFHGLT